MCACKYHIVVWLQTVKHIAAWKRKQPVMQTDIALCGLAFLADNNNNDNNLQVSCYSPLEVCGVVDVVDVVGVVGVGVGVVCSFVVVIIVMLVLVWLLSL